MTKNKTKARKSNWRPIETAPKDRPILACVWSDDAYYDWSSKGSISFAPITVKWGTYHPNSPGEKCWRDGNGHKRPYLTHWDDCPEPPKRKKS